VQNTARGEGEGKILENGVNNRHRAFRIAGEEYIYGNDKGNWASEANIWVAGLSQATDAPKGKDQTFKQTRL
jgi:hypothetical protein